MNEQNRWQQHSVQIAIAHITMTLTTILVHVLLGNDHHRPQITTSKSRQGLVLGKMADDINELDMEFTTNVGEIITSNAEE